MLNTYQGCLRALGFGILCLLLNAENQVFGEQRTALFDQTVQDAAKAISSSVVQIRYLLSNSNSPEVSDEGLISTGFLLDQDGWILTSDYGLPANHQAENSSTSHEPVAILVTLANGSEQTAELIARDFPRRLALLRTKEAISTVVRSRPTSRLPQPGETAILLGRGYESDRVNLSVGIISAVDRLAGRAIQIDANTSASNYGGPLVNLAGEWLGVVAPLGPPGQKGEAWYDSGIGFAVPYTAIEKRLAFLQSGQDIHAGWAGIQLTAGNPFSTSPKINKTIGPAKKSGLRPGDIITQVADRPTPTVARFRRELRRYDAHQNLTMMIRSGEEMSKVSITLSKKPKQLEKTPDEPELESQKELKEASPPVE